MPGMMGSMGRRGTNGVIGARGEEFGGGANGVIGGAGQYCWDKAGGSLVSRKIAPTGLEKRGRRGIIGEWISSSARRFFLFRISAGCNALFSLGDAHRIGIVQAARPEGTFLCVEAGHDRERRRSWKSDGRGTRRTIDGAGKVGDNPVRLRPYGFGSCCAAGLEVIDADRGLQHLREAVADQEYDGGLPLSELQKRGASGPTSG